MRTYSSLDFSNIYGYFMRKAAEVVTGMQSGTRAFPHAWVLRASVRQTEALLI